MENIFKTETGEIKDEFEWINYVDNECLELYALQFANCIRIIKNKAVFLFDEVGSGKTISAGLMAMICLSRFKEDVLIISTPSQAGSSIQNTSPFLDDWNRECDDPRFRGKFESIISKEEWKERIHIINYDYRNIYNIQKHSMEADQNKKYSLMIIKAPFGALFYLIYVFSNLKLNSQYLGMYQVSFYVLHFAIHLLVP